MFNKISLKNFSKLKIIYFRDGLKGVVNVIFSFLGLKFRLINDDQKKIVHKKNYKDLYFVAVKSIISK